VDSLLHTFEWCNRWLWNTDRNRYSLHFWWMLWTRKDFWGFWKKKLFMTKIGNWVSISHEAIVPPRSLYAPCGGNKPSCMCELILFWMDVFGALKSFRRLTLWRCHMQPCSQSTYFFRFFYFLFLHFMETKKADDWLRKTDWLNDFYNLCTFSQQQKSICENFM